MWIYIYTLVVKNVRTLFHSEARRSNVWRNIKRSQESIFSKFFAFGIFVSFTIYLKTTTPPCVCVCVCVWFPFTVTMCLQAFSSGFVSVFTELRFDITTFINAKKKWDAVSSSFEKAHMIVSDVNGLITWSTVFRSFLLRSTNKEIWKLENHSRTFFMLFYCWITHDLYYFSPFLFIFLLCLFIFLLFYSFFCLVLLREGTFIYVFALPFSLFLNNV